MFFEITYINKLNLGFIVQCHAYNSLCRVCKELTGLVRVLTGEP